MKIILFIATLSLSILVVSIAMLYLRRSTRRVINELCHSDASAEFWLRSADILAYSGAVMLVLIFGNASNTEDLIEVIRVTLILTLSGIFITVIFVSRNVWRSISPQKETK